MFRCDGNSCVFTGSSFTPIDLDGMDLHIIPNSIPARSVSGSMSSKWLHSMFAGPKVLGLVVQQLKSIGNVMNIEMNI